MSVCKGLKCKTLDGQLVLIHDGGWMSEHCSPSGSYFDGTLSYRLNTPYSYQESGKDAPTAFYVYLNQKEMSVIGRIVRLELVQILGKTPLYRCRRPMADGEDLVYDCQISEDFVECVFDYVFDTEYEPVIGSGR